MNATSHTEKCDELLELLCHRHRRQILRFLDNRPTNTATVDELVSHVDSPSGESSLSTRMHHVHLPKLADSGLIEWDSRSETVRYYPEPLCQDMLQTLRSHSAQPTNA
jgi:hypothetical protein